MKSSQHLRTSLLAILALFLVVAVSSCSKKDVTQDEPGFSTSEAAGDAAMDEGVAQTDLGAGAAGMPSTDMRAVYFGYDSYSLDGVAREALKANAEWLKGNAATVQIEGHCDERGTTEYNLALGERRANAVFDYLSSMGIDRSRLSVISYGEERPADPGHDEGAWSRNRRAEFVVLSQ